MTSPLAIITQTFQGVAPETDAPQPAVFFYSDTLRNVETTDPLLPDLTTALAEAGFIVATHLLDPRAVESKSTWAGAVVDHAADLFEALAEHPRVDPQRLGVLGHRLGSIVAGCLCGRSDRIAALCLLSPLTAKAISIRNNGNGNGAPPSNSNPPRANLPGVEPEAAERIRAAFENASPADFAASRPHPTLIIHPGADRVVDPQCAAPYLEAFAAAGQSPRREFIARADHECPEPALRSVCIDRICAFFNDTLAP